MESTKDKSRLHRFGTKMLPRIFIVYALNSGGKSKEVGVKKMQETFICLCADGKH